MSVSATRARAASFSAPSTVVETRARAASFSGFRTHLERITEVSTDVFAATPALLAEIEAFKLLNAAARVDKTIKVCEETELKAEKIESIIQKVGSSVMLGGLIVGITLAVTINPYFIMVGIIIMIIGFGIVLGSMGGLGGAKSNREKNAERLLGLQRQTTRAVLERHKTWIAPFYGKYYADNKRKKAAERESQRLQETA